MRTRGHSYPLTLFYHLLICKWFETAFNVNVYTCIRSLEGRYTYGDCTKPALRGASFA